MPIKSDDLAVARVIDSGAKCAPVPWGDDCEGGPSLRECYHKKLRPHGHCRCFAIGRPCCYCGKGER